MQPACLRRASRNMCSAWTKKPRRLFRPVRMSVRARARIASSASSRRASSSACSRTVPAICAYWVDTRSSSALRAEILHRVATDSSRIVPSRRRRLPCSAGVPASGQPAASTAMAWRTGTPTSIVRGSRMASSSGAPSRRASASGCQACPRPAACGVPARSNPMSSLTSPRTSSSASSTRASSASARPARASAACGLSTCVSSRDSVSRACNCLTSAFDPVRRVIELSAGVGATVAPSSPGGADDMIASWMDCAALSQRRNQGWSRTRSITWSGTCLCRMWRLAPAALRSARMFNSRATASVGRRGRFGSSYTPVRCATSDFRPSFRDAARHVLDGSPDRAPEHPRREPFFIPTVESG